ncbi:MAG: hypothetical protein ABIK48_00915 [candidate division WOR-3 bacterium]
MSRDKGTVDDKNFNELVERWRTASSDERDTFYRERLWPELKKRFKSISGYEQPEILLSLVGTSPEPVILTILALAPRRVHFICSTETERQLRFIVSETGLQPDQYDKTILKGIETGEVYQGFNELLNRYQGRKLACDITGGKKAMVVGAALISFLKNIPCYYVDPREYLADLRRPRPGSEEIVQLSNPYQVFRSVEEELADKLYNCGSYQPASEIYNTLCRKIPDPRKCHVKALVSSSYGEWFEFRFRSAYNFLSEAVNCAEQYRLFMDHVPRWKEQMEFLKPLTEDDRNKYYELLKKEEYRRSALISLAVKAQIALDAQQASVIALCSYRIIELAGQISLVQHNINPGQVEGKIRQDYQQAFSRLHKEVMGSGAEVPVRLGLIHTYMMLYLLKDRLVAEENEDFLKGMRKKLDIRNGLWIEHGNATITMKEAEEFFGYALNWLKKLYPDYQDMIHRIKPVPWTTT